MYFVIKYFIVIAVLLVFSSCGNNSNNIEVRNEMELAHRSATIISLQKDVMETVDSLADIYNDYGDSYAMACHDGGEVIYAFSETVFPVTLNYNNCKSARTHTDGNNTISEKNGTLLISGSELNATVSFQGDFNNTVITDDDKTFETIVLDTSIINVKNVDTYSNRYLLTNILPPKVKTTF